jgi:hypothetical protein
LAGEEELRWWELLLTATAESWEGGRPTQPAPGAKMRWTMDMQPGLLTMASAGRPLGVAGTDRLREYQCCFFISLT